MLQKLKKKFIMLIICKNIVNNFVSKVTHTNLICDEIKLTYKKFFLKKLINLISEKKMNFFFSIIFQFIYVYAYIFGRGGGGF